MPGFGIGELENLYRDFDRTAFVDLGRFQGGPNRAAILLNLQ